VTTYLQNALTPGGAQLAPPASSRNTAVFAPALPTPSSDPLHSLALRSQPMRLEPEAERSNGDCKLKRVYPRLPRHVHSAGQKRLPGTASGNPAPSEAASGLAALTSELTSNRPRAEAERPSKRSSRERSRRPRDPSPDRVSRPFERAETARERQRKRAGGHRLSGRVTPCAVYRMAYNSL